ncbi:MAG: nucleotidyltransferase domain-containing protein [Patescibacteria group bacterium]
MTLNKKLQFNKQILNKHKIAGLILFGSQIKGNKHPKSDIDVAVIFEKPSIRLQKPVEVYGDLYAMLAPLVKSDENLDIVYLDEAPINLKFKAMEEGKPLYIHNPRFFADFRERTMLEYFDFKPVLDESNQIFLDK